MGCQSALLDDLPDYRIYVLGPDESVAAVWRLKASDDGDAIAKARQAGGSGPVELWDGLRFIEQFQG